MSLQHAGTIPKEDSQPANIRPLKAIKSWHKAGPEPTGYVRVSSSRHYKVSKTFPCEALGHEGLKSVASRVLNFSKITAIVAEMEWKRQSQDRSLALPIESFILSQNFHPKRPAVRRCPFAQDGLFRLTSSFLMKVHAPAASALSASSPVLSEDIGPRRRMSQQVLSKCEKA